MEKTEAGEPDPTAERDGDTRLFEAVSVWQREVEAGVRPRKSEFLARYPEVADQLTACLDGMAMAQLAAGELRDEPAREATPPLDPAKAQPLGDFRLLRQIGRGGMGVVYEAEQVSLGRRIALKVLPLAAALDPRQLQRFRNEALAAAGLHHTNVVPVYAVGCERSVHYYAMQLIEGQSLADAIRELRQQADAEADATRDSGFSTLTVQRQHDRAGFHRTVALLGAQAADGLAYAHRHGVIHRDIKPGNLLLDTEGTLWIADFGLAQLHAEAAVGGLTRTGDVLGTLRYMSPEQASGRAVLLDQRTDIYALAATLFELLTLQPAVTGSTQVAVLKQIHECEPPSAAVFDPTVPAELDVILQKGMARDAADRYADADALAADLRRFLADKPILARPPTAAQKLARWTRRHRRAVTVGVVLLCMLSVGLLTTTAWVARANHRVAAALLAEQARAAEAEHAHARALEVVDLLTRFAAEDLRGNPLADDARRTLLASAMGYYQDLLATPEGAGAGETASIADARATIAAILAELDAMERLRRVGERVELLLTPSVQAELGLPEDPLPRDELREIFGSAQPAADESLTPAQQTDRFDGAALEAGLVLAERLNGQQNRRLQEIARQVRGPRAVAEPAVAAALALNGNQKTRLHELLSRTRDAWIRLQTDGRPEGPPPGRGRRPGPPAASPEELRVHAEALAAFLGLLTPGQRTTWDALTGAPFPRVGLPRGLGSGLGPIFGTGGPPPGP